MYNDAAAEDLQHSFVRSGCIPVMLDAVASVMAAPTTGEPSLTP